MENFSQIENIGEGTYGVVYKAKDRITGEVVALKKIDLTNEQGGVPSTALREASLLRALRHEGVVRLRSVVLAGRRLLLVLEYMPGDLRRALDSRPGGLPPALARSYLRQLLSALQHCHARLILHRDLKPQNILVDGAGHLKLADFGLARAAAVPLRAYTREVVTLWYRAPELLLGARLYSAAVDIWSAAAIALEMAAGRAAFPGDSEIDQLFRVFRALGTPAGGSLRALPDFRAVFPCWPARSVSRLLPGSLPSVDAEPLAELLTAMLRYEPRQRASARQALQHRYFTDSRLVRPDLPCLDSPES